MLEAGPALKGTVSDARRRDESNESHLLTGVSSNPSYFARLRFCSEGLRMIVNFRHRKGVLHATTGPLSTARVAALLIVIVQPAAALGSRTVRPDEARDHAMRGISSAKVGNLPQAERELQQAVRMAPGVAQYHAQLASILGLQGKWKPALESFEKAIDLAPGNLDFRRETAAVQWQLGLMSSAEKNLQYVLTRHPQDSGSILLLGMVKEKTGDYAKAAELLNAQFALVSSQPDRVVAMFHSVVESRQSEKIEKIVEVLKLHANDSSWSAAISPIRLTVPRATISAPTSTSAIRRCS